MPLLTASRAEIRWKSVDLPAPLGPISACRSPTGISRSTPRMISVLPNDLRTPLSFSAAAALAIAWFATDARCRRVHCRRSRSSISLDLALHAVPFAAKAPPHEFERERAGKRGADRQHPGAAGGGIERQAEQRGDGRARGLERQVVAELDDHDHADAEQQRAQQHAGVGVAQAAEQAVLRHPQVHQHQRRDAAGRVHHHQHEERAEVELPGLGVVRQRHREEDEDHRAEDRPEEEHRAADEDRQQHAARAQRRDVLRRHQFEVDGGEAAGDAGEEGRHDHHDEAHVAGAVADELDPFRIVAHRIGDPPERRAREGEHGQHRDEAPGGDQVVDLDAGPEA